jgi:threonine/homoserine/homoserine lactone efflux protein
MTVVVCKKANMLTFSQTILFSSASLVLIFTPGPDILYVMSRGIAQGRQAALAAAAGFSLGNIVHTTFAVVGLSALLASSATAFQMVKYAGAIYLVYLGIKMIRSTSALAPNQTKRPLSLWVIFRQSIVANVLNPKVAIFFLAFFPQFIEETRGGVALQMLCLGGIFVVLTFLGFGLVGYGSGAIGAWLQAKPRIGGRIGKLAGSVLILLGLRLAWPEVR